jgi:hypothetical protein
MRQNLATATSTDHASSGPSLKETLDWLKATLPLAANHYVLDLTYGVLGKWMVSQFGNTKDVTDRTIPINFDSCTVIYDFTEVWLWEAFREHPWTNTTRTTIPLGAIRGGNVRNNSMTLSESKKLDVFVLSLDASSKVILEESRGRLNSTESRDFNIFVALRRNS